MKSFLAFLALPLFLAGFFVLAEPVSAVTCESLGGACRTGQLPPGKANLCTTNEQTYNEASIVAIESGLPLPPVQCGGDCCLPIRTGITTVTDAAKTPTSTSPKPTAGSPTTLTDPLGGVTIYGLINRVITFFLGMVGALAFAVFVFAGVTWMTAGSSDRVKVAKDSMKYAVIGLALIAFSFAITNFIIDALVGQGEFAAPEPEPVFEEAGQLGE
jgi:hypothetical protein